MTRTYDIAIAGATGAVGEVFMRVAFERNFPIRNLRLLASSRSAGKQIKYGNELLTVLETNEDALEGVDLVFCSIRRRFWYLIENWSSADVPVSLYARSVTNA